MEAGDRHLDEQREGMSGWITWAEGTRGGSAGAGPCSAYHKHVAYNKMYCRSAYVYTSSFLDVWQTSSAGLYSLHRGARHTL